jgi:hypothetical protein
MRKILVRTLVVSLSLGLAVAARADGPADQKVVIDKAIKAMGGAEKLAKYQAATWNEKGTYYGMGDGLPYTAKYAVQWPDQFRMDIENVFLLVLDRDKGWIIMNNQAQDMTKEQLKEQKEQRYAGWVATLAPLKDKAFTLAALGESKVGDRPALGVKVSHEGHRDVSLFFDKETGLLVKSEYRVNADELGGKEVNQEAFFSGHLETDGIKVFRKIVVKRDGKLFVEAEISDFKPAEKLDSKLFAKP